MAGANLAIVVTKNSSYSGFSTETTHTSSMFRMLRQPSFQQYLLGGAVFRVACASAQLSHCIADSGRIPVDRDSVFKHHKALSRCQIRYKTCNLNTVVPVFRGLCDQGTPAVSGQYNDVRGDFQYKLTLDQGTPANADADRHLFVIFAPQPGDSALFILFFITLGRKRYHTGSQTLSNLFAIAHSIAQTDVNSRSCIPRKIMTPPADVRLGISEGYSDAR